MTKTGFPSGSRAPCNAARHLIPGRRAVVGAVVLLLTLPFQTVPAADSALESRAEAAIDAGDCAAMQALVPELEKPDPAVEDTDSRAALRERLVDAMLTVPDCGRMEFGLVRARTREGVPVFDADAARLDPEEPAP